MDIVTQYRRVFVLAIFDENEKCIGTCRFLYYDQARFYGRKSVELGDCVTFKVMPHDTPVHGITISTTYW